ncbi:class I SAM-dependent methyltransferase [Sphingobium sp. YC-XJ3]|uniref:class I SAM-dependent methyltransferase n=1 Tax=Sphingobium sp. YC-XJ3 TaxID=3024245 RepID=UPI00235E8744|nr:methyltransferase domain-containing protein [Sphingobium sp. YC-XJ3]WDA36395.1 methyltransferase domain-containing protein [Sphingobium sp. YC-XJ3]
MQALAESKQTRKINIGCGYDKRPGYLNVDMDPACEPDVLLVDNDFSQFERHSFDEVLAHDVLEHIPRSETANALLEWAELLPKGGRLVFQTSNILGVADLISQHQMYELHAKYTVFLFGNQQHPGDFHLTGFTDRTLRVHLLAAGFSNIVIEPTDQWMFSGSGIKASSWTRLLTIRGLSDGDFVEQATAEALLRSPEPEFTALWSGWLKRGACTRRDLLKMLHASEERRLRIAAQNCL